MNWMEQHYSFPYDMSVNHSEQLLTFIIDMRWTAFTLQLKSRFHWEEPQLLQHLPSIIGQRTLLRLELLDVTLSQLVNQFRQLIKYTFLHLRLACDHKHPFYMIIARSPNLKTFLCLMINQIDPYMISIGTNNGSLHGVHNSLKMTQVQSLLSQMSTLRHLKIVTSSADMTDGCRWEELIKSKLPR